MTLHNKRVVSDAMFASLAMLVMAFDAPPSEITLIERAVLNKLRDPESARFQWPNGFVKYTPANGIEERATCGTVNARNGYGGYTGKVAVLGAIRNGVATIAMDSPNDNFMPVKRTCADIGAPVNN